MAAIRAGRSCTTDQLVEVIDALVTVRGAPEHVRMDNRPEMIAWGLRGEGRLSGSRATYIEPVSPLGESLRRVLRRPAARRAAQRQPSSRPHRRPGRCRSLARRVQHLPSPLRPGRSHPRPVRRALDPLIPTDTPAVAGLTSGDASPRVESFTQNVIGRWLYPLDPVDILLAVLDSSTHQSGNRASVSSSAARACIRAKCAPMQVWKPQPNAM